MIVESTYGSDKAGLVCGYLFTPGTPGRPIESGAAGDHLARRDNAVGFLWLHFSLANTACEHWRRW